MPPQRSVVTCLSDAPLLRQSLPPVVGMTSVVFDHENSEFVVDHAIVNGEGEPPHRVGPEINIDLGPEIGIPLNLGDRCFEFLQETIAEFSRTSLVEKGGLDQFGLGFRMVGQSHPIARRAAFMTSS